MTRLTGRACEHCTNLFLAVRSNHRFCSTNCRVANHRAEKKGEQEVQVTFVEYISDAISQLSYPELIGALGVLWTETPGERAARKESLLYTLTKGKQQQ